MDRVTEKELKGYYSRIIRLSVCDRRRKRELLCQLKENISELMSETPDVTMEEIEKAFGTAESIAESFTLNAGSGEIRRQVQLKRLLIIAAVIAIVIYALFVVLSLIDVHTEAHGYFEEGLLSVGRVIKDGGIL